MVTVRNTNAHEATPMSLGAKTFDSYLHARNVAAGSDASKKPVAKIVVHAHDKLSVTNEWYSALQQDLRPPEALRARACVLEAEANYSSRQQRNRHRATLAECCNVHHALTRFDATHLLATR